ncbi:hypothetical protein MP638_006545 [Amoeboaphelidium occidentale]|nr:hypothetical protein MP638_006545 [Amoeboaphelidium occidentale]
MSLLFSQQQQPRISMTATIDNDVPELKSFLFDFFKAAKLFAKIRHEVNNTTSVLVQGHPKIVPPAMDFLKDLLLTRFDAVPMLCSAPFPTEDNDRLESVMIEETPAGMKRDNSSGEFREIPLEEVSFGASANTEYFKMLLQDTVASISPLGRAVGVLKSEEKHISVEYLQKTRYIFEVSGMVTLDVLYSAVTSKFNLAVPIEYIYKVDPDGMVVVMKDITDLEKGAVYFVITKNDPEPQSACTSAPTFASMNEFYELLKKNEGLVDRQITIIQAVFKKEDIDLKQLYRLTDQDLEKVGLTLGLRKAILVVLGK